MSPFDPPGHGVARSHGDLEVTRTAACSCCNTLARTHTPPSELKLIRLPVVTLELQDVLCSARHNRATTTRHNLDKVRYQNFPDSFERVIRACHFTRDNLSRSRSTQDTARSLWGQRTSWRDRDRESSARTSLVKQALSATSSQLVTRTGRDRVTSIVPCAAPESRSRVTHHARFQVGPAVAKQASILRQSRCLIAPIRLSAPRTVCQKMISTHYIAKGDSKR